MGVSATSRPRFYLDAGSPYAWLAAERVERVLDCEVAWEPVLLGAIFAARGFGSWSLTDARADAVAEAASTAGVEGEALLAAAATPRVKGALSA
jgi:2-hydroxychromene-2-carboxylate isomerase